MMHKKDEGGQIYSLHNWNVKNINEFFKTKNLDKEFIDVTITSPPYFDMKTYGVKDQLGYGQKYEVFLNEISTVFGSIYKYTRKTGSLWIIVDTFTRDKKLISFPFDLINKLKELGWIHKDIFIWKKDKSLPYVKKGNLRNIKEYILFFIKDNNFKFYTDRIRDIDISSFREWWVKYPEKYNPKGRLPSNIWDFSLPTQGSWGSIKRKHLNPLPYKIIERIVTLSSDTDDVVFDPFAGIGTILAVAKKMNRKSIGFEINEKYLDDYYNFTQYEISREMDINNKLENEIFTLKTELCEKIIKLRILKYVKVHMRIINREIYNDNRNDVKLSFVLSDYDVNSYINNVDINKTLKDYVSINIFYICNSKLNNEDFEKIKGIMNNKPLSKYQLSPNVEIHKYKDYKKLIKKLKNYELWLYNTDKTYKYDKKTSLSEINTIIDNYDELNSNIISNIKLNETIPKTWKSKEQKNKEDIILFQKFLDFNEFI